VLKVAGAALLAGVLAVGATAGGHSASGTVVLKGLILKAIAAESAAVKAKTPAGAEAKVREAQGWLDDAFEALKGSQGRLLPTAPSIEGSLEAADDLDGSALSTYGRARKEKDKNKKNKLIRNARAKVNTAIAAKAKALGKVPAEVPLGCRVVSKTVGSSRVVIVDSCTVVVHLVRLTTDKGDRLGELGPADVEKGATTTKAPCSSASGVVSCPVTLDQGSAFILDMNSIVNETTVALLLQNTAGVQYGLALISARK
jgi:hypothetical protein